MIYCCVLTVYNTLYKFVNTQRDWDGFCQKNKRNRLHNQWINVVGCSSTENMEWLSVRKPGTFRDISCNWQICPNHVTAESFMSHHSTLFCY